jgi:hypothetical protein
MAQKQYRVLVGINYGSKRAEPGDVVGDLPVSQIEALIAMGAIEGPVERGN